MNLKWNLIRSSRILQRLVPVVLAVGAIAGVAQGNPAALASNQQAAGRLLAGLPLSFERNQGQLDARASFKASLPGATLFLTGADMTVAHLDKKTGSGASLMLHWQGAASSQPEAESALRSTTNYIIGNQSQWHTGVTSFERVRVRSLYPGIDLVYYGNQQQLEYDLTVAPGASAAQARLTIDGQRKLALEASTGDLLLTDALGTELRLNHPVAYQLAADGSRQRVDSAYQLAGNTVGFSLGSYDHTRPLVIDPQLIYSTLIYGSESTNGAGPAFNNMVGIQFDAAGHAYLAGYTDAIDMPTSTGSFQPSCSTTTLSGVTSCLNFYLAKFDTTQSGNASLLWATYFGNNDSVYTNYGYGGGNGDGSNKLALDASGNIYLIGAVNNAVGSGNIPIKNAQYPTCSFQISGIYSCVGFLAEFNSNGALEYSSWLSSNYGEYPLTIAIDSNQNAWVAMRPLTGPWSSGYSQVNVVNTRTATQLNNNAIILPFQVGPMAADSNGNVFIGGSNYSSTNASPINFEVTGGPFTGTTYANDNGGVLVEYGSEYFRSWGTFIGTNSGDTVNAIAVDSNSKVFIGGSAAGLEPQTLFSQGFINFGYLPWTTSTYFGAPSVGWSSAFVAEIDPTASDASSLLFASYLSPDPLGAVYAISANGTGQFAYAGQLGTTTVGPFLLPVNALPDTGVGNSVYAGVIDTNKAGENALIFSSYIPGFRNLFNVWLGSGSDGTTSGSTTPNYLYLGGQASTGFLPTTSTSASPLDATLASYQTVAAGYDPVSPGFYKLALGPIDCMKVVPSQLNFGQELVSATVDPTERVNVINTCKEGISITSVSTSAPFAVSTNNCPATLAAGANCQVQVKFAPTATGAASGSLIIDTPQATPPPSVALEGIGASTQTSNYGVFSITEYNFGGLLSGQSASVIVSFTNNSPNTINSSLPTFWGAPNDHGAFSIVIPTTSSSAPSPCGLPLTAGKACQFQVIFAPTAATLTANENSAGYMGAIIGSTGGQLNVYGFQIQPLLEGALTPNPLSFPNTVVGTKSSIENLTLTNDGNEAFTVGTLTAPSGFALANATTGTRCTNGLVLYPSASSSTPHTCNIGLEFVPTQGVTPYSTSFGLSVTPVGGTTPVTVSSTLEGQGEAPVLSYDQNPCYFANPYDEGDAVPTCTVNITNTGTANLKFTRISTAGLATGETMKLQTASTNCSTSSVLAPGKSCTLPVAYTMQSNFGSLTGTIQLTDNAPDSPQVVSYVIQSVAPIPSIVYGNGTLAFNPTSVGHSGTSASGTYPMLVNSGTGTLKNIQITYGTLTHSGSLPTSTTNPFPLLSSPPAGQTVTPCVNGGSVAPGDECALYLSFNPDAADSYTSSFYVKSNAKNSTGSLNLSGAGQGADISTTTTALVFPSTSVGFTSTTTKTITITNKGNVTLTVSPSSLTGTGFSVTGCAGGAAANGGTCTLTVSFTPVAAGSPSATLTLNSNAYNTAPTVSLSGTAVADAPVLSAWPSSYGFATIKAGTTSLHAFTVKNVGTANLLISGIGLTTSGATPPFALVTSGTGAGTCQSGSSIGYTAPNNSCTVVVKFLPTTATNYQTSLVLQTNIGAQTVTITGTGD